MTFDISRGPVVVRGGAPLPAGVEVFSLRVALRFDEFAGDAIAVLSVPGYSVKVQPLDGTRWQVAKVANDCELRIENIPAPRTGRVRAVLVISGPGRARGEAGDIEVFASAQVP